MSITPDHSTKHSRRSFLQGALGVAGFSCAAFGASALGPSASRAGEAAPKRPNVLFIAVDDLNDWASCLGGHPDAKTPHIDALAERGVLFTNAHCPAPLCNASRAALMTGIGPSTSGIYTNDQPWRKSPNLEDAVTLPQHFMAQGYTALGSGKIYHGRFPDPPSWDTYWPSKLVAMPPTPRREKNVFGNKGHFTWGPLDEPNEEMGDWKVADWVIEQLGEEHDKPFFLACGIYRPHLPWEVPQKYFDMFPVDDITLPKVKEDDLDDVPEAGMKMAKPEGDHAKVTEHNEWRNAVQAYLASMAFADDCVGRVIEALDKSAYRDSTVVVLWSDHGWHLGEKLHWRKFTLWEEATRNVLTFAAPGVEGGRRCGAPVNLLDVYPTLVALCGLEPRESLEGKSLVPLLQDTETAWEEPTLTTHGYNNHSLRSRRWRYTRYPDGSEELYDHDNDPMEWNNLAADPAYDEIKKELSAFLPKVNAEPV